MAKPLQRNHGAPKSRQLIQKCADKVQRKKKCEARAEEPELPSGRRVSDAKQQYFLLLKFTVSMVHPYLLI